MYGIFLGFGLMATETVRHPVVLGRRRESPATPHAAAAAWTSLHLLRATHTTRPRLAPSSQAIVILFILAQCCCSAAEEEHKRDAKLLDEDRLTSSAYPPAGGNSCTDTSSHQQLHWRLSTLHGAPAGLRCGWGGSRACIHTSACGFVSDRAFPVGGRPSGRYALGNMQNAPFTQKVGGMATTPAPGLPVLNA